MTRGVTLERYAADRMMRQAVERNFEIIGEAVKHQVPKLLAEVEALLAERG